LLQPSQAPSNGQDLGIDTRTYNALLRSPHCLCECGFRQFIGWWRKLKHITASPSSSANRLAALLLLHFKHG